MTDIVPDLTSFSDFELQRLEGRLGIPYVVLRRAQVEQLKAKAQADAKAQAEKDAADRTEAERKARTFTDACDQLNRLGRTPPVGDINAVDGPFVDAELAKIMELDQEHEAARREAVRPLSEHLGWDPDYAATRPVECMRNEAAASQGSAFLILRGIAKYPVNAFRKMTEGRLGWLPPSVNRSRSRRRK